MTVTTTYTWEETDIVPGQKFKSYIADKEIFLIACKDDEGKPLNKRGRGTKKTPVVGMIERDGNVKAKVVKKDELKAKDLERMIRENIDIEHSTLFTDEYRGYAGVKKFIEHRAINHQYEYANGEVSTNWIEGFWALLKRGIMGQYHKVSIRYLEKYVDEFCFRYNYRKADSDDVFENVLGKMIRA
jgi:transposase-like protein